MTREFYSKSDMLCYAAYLTSEVLKCHGVFFTFFVVLDYVKSTE